MKTKLLVPILFFMILASSCPDPLIKVTIVSTMQVETLGYTTATIKGSIIENSGNVSDYGHCWGTSENPTTSNNKTSFGKTTTNGDFTSELSGLAAGTKYYIRAYAIDGKGIVYSGNVANFTTQGYIPATLTTNPVSDITHNSATNGGNIISDGGSPVTARGVCWSTSENPTIANSKTNDGTGTGSFTSNISGLIANTAYYVRAFATNLIGTNYGNVQTFKTREVYKIELSSPTNVTNWIIGTQYIISWTDNITENVKIELFKGGTKVVDIVNSTASNGSYNYTPTSNLTEGSDYQIKITSINDINITAFSNNFSITAEKKIVITYPIANTNWPMGSNQTITWTDNIAENVKIELFLDGVLKSTISSSTASDGSEIYAIPTNLLLSKNYTIKISSIINSSISSTSGNFQISEVTGSTSTLTDIQNNVYSTVKIGTQWWMSENLKVEKYNNNTVIPIINGETEWSGLTSQAFSWLYSDVTNKSKGGLYNWYAVNNGALCPTGWHVPTNDDWNILFNFLGGTDVAGGKMKTIGLTNWSDPNTGATNTSGFSAKATGLRNALGLFNDVMYEFDVARFWSKLENNSTDAYLILISSSSPAITWYTWSKKYGLSVRCLKD